VKWISAGKVALCTQLLEDRHQLGEMFFRRGSERKRPELFRRRWIIYSKGRKLTTERFINKLFFHLALGWTLCAIHKINNNKNINNNVSGKEEKQLSRFPLINFRLVSCSLRGRGEHGSVRPAP
jgi:hypothetical protein